MIPPYVSVKTFQNTNAADEYTTAEKYECIRFTSDYNAVVLNYKGKNTSAANESTFLMQQYFDCINVPGNTEQGCAAVD